MDFIKKNLFMLLEVALLVLAAIFVISMPQFVVETKIMGLSNTVKYAGKDVIFGNSDKGTEFCFMNFLALLLVAAAAVLAVLKILMPKNAKLLNLIIVVCAIVAAVLLFMGTTDMMATFKHGKLSDVKDVPGTTVKLGVGYILGGIAAACGGVLACLESFVFKK